MQGRFCYTKYSYTNCFNSLKNRRKLLMIKLHFEKKIWPISFLVAIVVIAPGVFCHNLQTFSRECADTSADWQKLYQRSQPHFT